MVMPFSVADRRTHRVCPVQPPLDPALHFRLEYRYAGAKTRTDCTALLCHELRHGGFNRRLITATGRLRYCPSGRPGCDIQVTVSQSISGHIWTLIEAPTPTLCLRHVLGQHRILQLLAESCFPGAICRSGVSIPRTDIPTPGVWQSQASLAMVEASQESGNLCFFGPQLIDRTR